MQSLLPAARALANVIDPAIAPPVAASGKRTRLGRVALVGDSNATPVSVAPNSSTAAGFVSDEPVGWALG